MTYGEYHYLVKYDMKLKNGKWVATKPHSSIPKKMSRDSASTYYKEVFRLYWKTKRLDESCDL